ncbi:nucleolar protein 58-like [Oscarella lobularis]|uniref:nucleolar protein 58-like n=1 Tax=Oscarella lobularis TaxID=121494 RepID=UPI003313544F
MAEALSAATASIEGKMTRNLKKLLKKVAHDELAVADAKLGSSIKDKLSISCVTSSAVQELMRGIRSQFTSLLSDRWAVDVIRRLEKEDLSLSANFRHFVSTASHKSTDNKQ